MKTIIIIGIIFCVYKIISKLSAESKERKQEEERQRIQEEQAALRAEQARQREEIKAQIERNKLEVKERIEAEKRRIEWQKRQDAINARLEKEQERQAAQLERHEEMLMKLDHRLAQAESEIAFNREQRERIFSLLEIEEAERDACIHGSSAWQKHQRKVISLENQVHTVQKRIDKAQADKRLCERKLA